jgi:hypothetical protein
MGERELPKEIKISKAKQATMLAFLFTQIHHPLFRKVYFLLV